jgi:hypothetical protein
MDAQKVAVRHRSVIAGKMLGRTIPVAYGSEMILAKLCGSVSRRRWVKVAFLMRSNRIRETTAAEAFRCERVSLAMLGVWSFSGGSSSSKAEGLRRR